MERQWFLGPDTCEGLIPAPLREINTHRQLIKELPFRSFFKVLKKWPCVTREPKIFREGPCLDAFGVRIFLLRNSQGNKECIIDSCFI